MLEQTAAHADYWKERYRDQWERSGQRERMVAERITKETGYAIDYCGLGAGSTDFISGSAPSNGHQTGAADLQVVGTDIFIEVTGPGNAWLEEHLPLWVRPDKIRNAYLNRNVHTTYVVHCIEGPKLMRVIPLDATLFEALRLRKVAIIHPIIRGVEERYFALPAHSPFVHPWERLIEDLGRKE